ncbi:hypothetical protein ABES25_06630 [Bacillus gobiensis]|uniref:hypothetical protein n=1 Tax=Bacillus gobiensis TaxID=1441095 RepID=UPI003D1CFDB9
MYWQTGSFIVNSNGSLAESSQRKTEGSNLYRSNRSRIAFEVIPLVTKRAPQRQVALFAELPVFAPAEFLSVFISYS